MSQLNRTALILGLLLLLPTLSPRSAPAEEPLTLYYFHRPPYYVAAEDGTATGFLLEIAKHVMRRCGIRFRFVELPPKRILKRIMKGEACGSVGWFRTPEREAFARFSEPIYRNRPLCIVTRKDLTPDLSAEPTIQGLFTGGLRVGLIDGFSYGTWADRAIERFGPKKSRIAATQENLLEMVSRSRIDYVLMAPEEAAYVLDRTPSFRRDLELVALADAPPGNQRHIMYGKGVDGRVVEKIDRVLRTFVETETYETLTRLPGRLSP